MIGLPVMQWGHGVLTVMPWGTHGGSRGTHGDAMGYSRGVTRYVIGLPVMLLSLTNYAHARDKLKDPKWLLVMGLNYKE